MPSVSHSSGRRHALQTYRPCWSRIRGLLEQSWPQRRQVLVGMAWLASVRRRVYQKLWICKRQAGTGGPDGVAWPADARPVGHCRHLWIGWVT